MVITLLAALTCVFIIPTPYVWRASLLLGENRGKSPIKDLRPQDTPYPWEAGGIKSTGL